jgi:RNA polymerase sigma factor (sigma-70 family)
VIKSGLVSLTDPIPSPDAPPDDQTLLELMEGVRSRLKRLLRSYDIPPEDAEDIVQEALLDALRKWDTIRQKDAWLLGTVRFKCSNYWKKRRGDRVEAFDLAALEELSEPQAPDQEQKEISMDLRSLTRGVDGRHRAALWLRFGVGLSPAEIARQLGYSATSIRKLTGRCLARLQRGAAGGPGGSSS